MVLVLKAGGEERLCAVMEGGKSPWWSVGEQRRGNGWTCGSD